jgi:C4-dicarboxylate-specific signal transduction histidine kinase
MDADIREVAFFGRITAAFTHDMKNVLAIIKESAGLMGDLLSLIESSTFPHKERFVRSLTMIETQTTRGVELSNRLNRFAHSPDEAVAVVELNEILGQIIYLAERFARLKRVTLSLNPHGQDVPVVVSPVRLQMAVFGCLECCWGFMAAGGKISLSVEQRGQEAIIRFACESGADVAEALAGWFSDAEASQAMQETAESLNSRIECSTPEPGLQLILPVAG